jgi:hypothetical protein
MAEKCCKNSSTASIEKAEKDNAGIEQFILDQKYRITISKFSYCRFAKVPYLECAAHDERDL